MQIIKGSDLLELGRAMAGLDALLASIPPLDEICDACGARMGDHRIGGPGPSCPHPRKPALWFWR